MKKRIVALLALNVLIVGMIVGCGDNNRTPQETTPEMIETIANPAKKIEPEDINKPIVKESPTSAAISEKKAKKIALKDAGVQLSNVQNLLVTLDFDDGRKVYDVEFMVGNKEYEYTIDADTGKILDRDADIEF